MCDKMYVGEPSSVSQIGRVDDQGGGFEAEYYTNYPRPPAHLHIITGPSSSNINPHTLVIVLNAKIFHDKTI